MRCEMKTALFRIWTLVAKFTPYNDSHYSMSISVKQNAKILSRIWIQVVNSISYYNNHYTKHISIELEYIPFQ